MQLPQTVQIGPYTYRIDDSELEAARVAANERDPDNLGEARMIDQVIVLNPEQADDSKADTLLHEILHVAWFVTALHRGPAADHEELVVCALTTSLLDTLRRNPDLVAYLVGS